MDLNHAALHAACYGAAQKTMLDARPTDVLRIKKLADTFYALCLEHISRIKKQGRDPNILVRAVSYLAETHAIQPMHDKHRVVFFHAAGPSRACLPGAGEKQRISRIFNGYPTRLGRGEMSWRGRVAQRKKRPRS
ncbi:MAG: hypothetical protein M0C28_21435 [Candidatus Moduliflexus flocculans]|nr:hypothetical protein [Candidatus Moduliflexus flocculans]